MKELKTICAECGGEYLLRRMIGNSPKPGEYQCLNCYDRMVREERCHDENSTWCIHHGNLIKKLKKNK